MVTMIFIKLLNVLNFFFALAFSAGLFSVLRPIQHSYRLTKLQSVTSNKSIGNSYAEYVQYYDKQFINLNCTTYLKVIPYRGYIELIKCKEYYMDCKIHKVMEITNICDKVEYGLSLIQIGYRNREIKCPFQMFEC
ncbi:uncharacterized protein LOC126902757 isoform X2 [Daktulosphaira vitifoliae]|uniref:uncharacterized protein LOC126902757 isoform X2 n=1 Tax=Daktulosphaira vitifoliae TaxID=58002 RepID=UPI0021AA62D7|nr:uncharacterized protein LOC126902757 isoform X2 [Daktulosphaira vitifoliae]